MHTKTVYQDDFHTIAYAPQNDCVVYQACGAPQSSEHLRQGLLKILEISRGNSRTPINYLADLRQTHMPPLPDTIWVNEVFLPLILKRGVRKMAWVVPERNLPQLAMEYVINKVIPPTCEWMFFDNPDDAQAWLEESESGF
jgi:hypothetical protein